MKTVRKKRAYRARFFLHAQFLLNFGPLARFKQYITDSQQTHQMFIDRLITDR